MSVYACSDLHGMKNLYDLIKEKLQPNDIVYFLGDACDRGFDGWEMIKDIYRNEQFVYLKGNHEDMFVKAVKHMNDNNEYNEHMDRYFRNGGEVTFNAWIKDGSPMDWVEKIEQLPIHIEYTNAQNQTILLSHAGYTPHKSPDGEIDVPMECDLLWDRWHCLDAWDNNYPNHIVVHGHTPIRGLAKKIWKPEDQHKLGAYWYCDDKKVCVDNGSFLTQTTCLLNLDTWESILITCLI